MGLPAVGEVFAGKYAIEAVVGRGGMGVVLAARHLELDERVAIKLILADDGPKAAEFIARFVREAKLASKIKSEHVVRVMDVARLPTGEPYIVMELLEGRDLAEMLTHSGPLPIDQVALYVLQACEAIAEAHALGIVHRDLKPANLFLATGRDGRPCVKVLDFGISKQMGEQAAHSMTKTNALMGSPLYMSPDQLVQSRDVDARSDVWALGVILFELLTGRPPFEAEDAPQLIAHILHRPPQSLAALRRDVPPELVRLIEAALVKDRERRIPNVAELSRGLLPYVPEAGRLTMERIVHVMARAGNAPLSVHDGTGSWRSSSSVAAGTPSATAGGASLDLGTTRKPSPVVPIVAALAGLLVLGGVGAFFVLGRGHAAEVPSAAAAPSPAPLEVEPPKAPAAAPAPIIEPPAATAEATAAATKAEPPKSKPSLPVRPTASARVIPVKKPAAVPADPFGGVR
jgi:serine/threonine-protein kinase